jgi:hypothetical protein
MTDLKCVRCGAVSLVASQLCPTCAIEMPSAIPHHTAPVVFPAYQPGSVWLTRSGSYTTDSSIGPFDSVGEVVVTTFRLFFDNLWLITKLVFVIVAPFHVLKVLSVGNIQTDWQFELGMTLLPLVCNVLIGPALLFALMKVMQTGLAPGINQCYRWGFSKLGKLGICATIAGTLQAVGYTLCFIPGIIIAVHLSLVFPIAILEKSSATEVLPDSMKLTKGHRWKILGAAILIYAFWGTIWLVTSASADLLGRLYIAYWPLPLAGIITDIAGQTTTILSLVIYLSIRRTLERERAQ